MSDLHALTIAELVNAIESGDVTSVQATEAALARADANDSSVGAWLHVDRDGALEQAKRADGGELTGPLRGVPIAIKDNINVAGTPMTCASKILAGYTSPYDATVVRRLRDAGAVILGKVNLDEFAMGSSCENSALKQTRNPFDLTRVPGGSSGGSSACVADGSAWGALGSDTGGSIRQPASFCGIVGFKPSYGLVSRYGVVAFASSLDQVGPMTRDVRDSALMLNALAGHDENDGTSSRAKTPDFVAGLDVSALKGKKIGVVRDRLGEGVAEDVSAAFNESLAVLKSAGATVVDVELAHAKQSIAVYYVVASAEASSNLARYDGIRFGARVTGENLEELYKASRSEGFGPEVRRRIMLGTYALSAGHYDEYYGRASRVRALIVEDYRKAFANVDAVVSPTSPFTAFKAGEIQDPLAMYKCDINTIPAALAGLCSVSVPTAFDRDGMPIGLQMTCPAFQDTTLLSLAFAYESERSLEKKLPVS